MVVLPRPPKPHFLQSPLPWVHPRLQAELPGSCGVLPALLVETMETARLRAVTVRDTPNSREGGDIPSQSISFLRTINFGNVRTLDYIYPKKSMDDAFYHQSILYLKAEETVCLDEARPYEFVQITVLSEDLEEVLADVKAV